jgi:hypothetical protein
MITLKDIPLAKRVPQTDYECLVWAGVIAETVTDIQTHLWFKARCEELASSLDEFSVARAKKEIMTTLDKYYEE